MARLVINDDITSGKSLTSGQVLQLDGFTMGARTVIEPTASPVIAKHHLCIGLEHSEKMDPADISSLNELLDRIAAWGFQQTMIGSGLNLTRGKSISRLSPTW